MYYAENCYLCSDSDPGPGTTRSVTLGHYLLLAPLDPGEHEIHFHGLVEFERIGFPEYGYFELDVTYFLTVSEPEW